MMDKIKQLKINVTFSALLSIVVGVLLVINPGESVVAIGKIIAAIVIIVGVTVIIAQLVEYGRNIPGMLVGGVIALIGVWMFASPTALMSIIPIAIGVILCIHGIQDMGLAMEGKNAGMDRSWGPFVVAIVNIILGVICILNAFGMVKLAFVVIGIMLIFDGLSDLGIVYRVKKATKDIVDSDIIDEEDI